MNNQNPENSSIKQILLDMRQVCSEFEDYELMEKVNSLIKEVDKSSKRSIVKKTDKIFKSHSYNDLKISFSKLQNQKTLKITSNLSPMAVKLLMLISQSVSQDNLICFTTHTFQKIVGVAPATLCNAISELVNSGCISLIKAKTKDMGNIYMLNPDIATCGKYHHKEIYKKITQELAFENFKFLNENANYCVISSKMNFDIDDDNQIYLSFNTLTLS